MGDRRGAQKTLEGLLTRFPGSPAAAPAAETAEEVSIPACGEAPKAVVLLSGGLDSATTLAWALREGYTCHCLSVDYGQRHRAELSAASVLAGQLGATSHKVVRLDLSVFGGSALTDASVAVPTDGVKAGIPVTYVPARNTILLSLALGWAEVLGAQHIFVGANAVDYSGYPDCRPEYLRAFGAMANLATKAAIEGRRIEVLGPLVSLSKAEIVKLAIELGVEPAQTVTCYQPDAEGRACGVCDACRIRRAGFEAAGLRTGHVTAKLCAHERAYARATRALCPERRVPAFLRVRRGRQQDQLLHHGAVATG
jgi:7-cyano-7-deazaguanine synthase